MEKANALDGHTWTRYSISIWSDIRRSLDELRLDHPAIFPVQLATRLIECFASPQDQIVLDPFAGSGTVLIAAEMMGKQGIGIEISRKYYDMALQRLQRRDMFQSSTPSSTMYLADARSLKEFIRPNSVDLVITSPPYWDVLTQERTADRKEIQDYDSNSSDLSKIKDYSEFLQQLAFVFRNVYDVLRPFKYCIVIVMDLRKKDRFYPFHSDVAAFMQDIGFRYEDIIIWDRRQEYHNMRPLGYPFVFRINKAHEYILVFRKPRA